MFSSIRVNDDELHSGGILTVSVFILRLLVLLFGTITSICFGGHGGSHVSDANKIGWQSNGTSLSHLDEGFGKNDNG